jgi:transposase
MGHDGTLDHRRQRKRGGSAMQVTTVGIDLAKNVFQLHACDATGKAVLRKQLGRRRLIGFMANLPRCLVAMEAGAGAHYWAREIEKAWSRGAAHRSPVRKAVRQSQ